MCTVYTVWMTQYINRFFLFEFPAKLGRLTEIKINASLRAVPVYRKAVGDRGSSRKSCLEPGIDLGTRNEEYATTNETDFMGSVTMSPASGRQLICICSSWNRTPVSNVTGRYLPPHCRELLCVCVCVCAAMFILCPTLLLQRAKRQPAQVGRELV